MIREGDCMNCSHTVPYKGPDGRLDFSRRVCVEGPGAMVALPAGPGQIQLVPMQPIVGPGNRCDRHDPVPPLSSEGAAG